MITKMTKKNRKKLIISLLIIILLLIVTTLVVLYLNTDMFKSNQTLFLKYIGNNVENLKEIENIFENTEYEKILENSKYVQQSEIKVNYTEDYRTTSENTSNSINNFKLTIDGQVDNVNQYNYKDLKLWKNDTQMLDIEYAQNNNIYGVRFSDLFKQYILVENSNLKDLLRKIGYSEEEIENIPDSIEINQDDFFNSIKFTDEEIENIREKYINIINENLSNENFEKKSKETISINEKDVIVNAYILKLTNEQLNDIYIKVLENLKNEEIILMKIEKMENFINKINFNLLDNINIRTKFIEGIDDVIETINRNNIGTEETRVIVYENQRKTLRTTIQGVDHQIDIDYMQAEEEQFMEISFQKSTSEIQKFTIKKNDKVFSLNIENEEDNNPTVISLVEYKNIEDEKCTKNINIKYEDESNKLEINSTIDINIVEEFENQAIFDDLDEIHLNTLEEEQTKMILNTVNEGIQQKLNELNQEIKIDDLRKILENIGIVKDSSLLSGEGISEIEKNRFNSKFEILEGENINSDNMLRIIRAIQDYIINLQVISNEEFKIEISRDNKNKEIVQTLENFIEKDKKFKYNIKLEHNEETGLVEYVVLTILDE